MSSFTVEDTARSRWRFNVVHSGRTYARCMTKSDAELIASVLNAHRRKDRPLSQSESDALARAVHQSK